MQWKVMHVYAYVTFHMYARAFVSLAGNAAWRQIDYLIEKKKTLKNNIAHMKRTYILAYHNRARADFLGLIKLFIPLIARHQIV